MRKKIAGALIASLAFMGSAGAQTVAVDTVEGYMRLCDRPGEEMSVTCGTFIEMAMQAGTVLNIFHTAFEKEPALASSPELYAMGLYAYNGICPEGDYPNYEQIQRVVIKRIKAQGYTDDLLALQGLTRALAKGPICKTTEE